MFTNFIILSFYLFTYKTWHVPILCFALEQENEDFWNDFLSIVSDTFLLFDDFVIL